MLCCGADTTVIVPRPRRGGGVHARPQVARPIALVYGRLECDYGSGIVRLAEAAGHTPRWLQSITTPCPAACTYSKLTHGGLVVYCCIYRGSRWAERSALARRPAVRLERVAGCPGVGPQQHIVCSLIRVCDGGWLSDVAFSSTIEWCSVSSLEGYDSVRICRRSGRVPETWRLRFLGYHFTRRAGPREPRH